MKTSRPRGTTIPDTAPGEPHTELQIGLLAPLALTSFIGLLNGFALGPFLPSISDDIGTSVPVLGQIATATFLMTAVGGLFVGPLADQLGHRRMILVGLVATIISAGGTALAPGSGSVLVTRMIGGVGGSVASGVPLAVAGSRFAGDARRRALSIITATVAAGAVVGAPMLTSIGAFFSGGSPSASSRSSGSAAWRVSRSIFRETANLPIPEDRRSQASCKPTCR
ncbi:MAG: MFS transporter [Thermomicrobiales bacterium]